jgi:hypothetical protein
MSQHNHEFSDWPFPCPENNVAFCTAKVARDGFPVLQVSHDTEGDWQFLDATTQEPGECVLMCLGCVVERDATLFQISDLPPGWSAYREHVGAEWERWQKPAEDDEDAADAACDAGDEDEKALADIAAYGLHIIQVAEEDELPPFSYSIGIENTLGMPELIVIGLQPAVAGAAINECYRQMKSGAAIKPGEFVAGLLGGDFKCLIGEVSPSYFRQYMGWARWLHKGNGFRAYQIIFPDTAGVFPWEPGASEWFRNRQPLLAASGMLGSD